MVTTMATAFESEVKSWLFADPKLDIHSFQVLQLLIPTPQ